MKRKMYSGVVIGYKKIKDNCYVNYVTTERLFCDVGEACDVVFSRTPYELLSTIEYSIYRTERGYTARA